jgi:putative transposase
VYKNVTLVTSEGDKYNFQFSETKQIKQASRQFNKAKKGTVKRRKTYKKLIIAHEKLDNKKKDAKNKFVSKLVRENDVVVIQDENLKAWHASKMKGFGRRVQYSIMGGIKAGLRIHPETLMISRFFTSTQLCPNCGSLNKHSLEDRIYSCSCGYSCDRDTHSAKNILNEGLKILGREPIKSLLNEEKTSTFKDSFLNASEYLMTSEAQAL